MFGNKAAFCSHFYAVETRRSFIFVTFSVNYFAILLIHFPSKALCFASFGRFIFQYVKMDQIFADDKKIKGRKQFLKTY